MEFKKNEIVHLYYVDDTEMDVVGMDCKCTNPNNKQFWLEDLRNSGTYGTHLFATEKEALEVAKTRFTTRSKRLEKLARSFKDASKDCLRRFRHIERKEAEAAAEAARDAKRAKKAAEAQARKEAEEAARKAKEQARRDKR